MLIIACFAVLLTGADSFSSSVDTFSIKQFGTIMVLESGRKKPMDTYARNKLIQFSGKQTLKGEPALEWMCRVLLEPQNAEDDLIFIINNPEIPDALGINPRAKRRYSYSELYNSMGQMDKLIADIVKKEQSEWTAFDKEIARVNRNVREYMLLRSIFSFGEPKEQFQITDTTVSAMLGISEHRPVSYLQLLYRVQRITPKIQEIGTKNSDSLSASEQAIIDITRRMREMEGMIGNPQPHIIPEFSFEGEQWYSPWGLLNRYKTDAMPHVLMNLMFTMRESYLRKSQIDFDDAVKQYREYVVKTFENNRAEINDPGAEILYNKLNPFFFSKVLYGIAALFSLLAVSYLWRYSYHMSLTLILSGLVLQTVGLIMRFVIMGHPPVSNLYETFVFTAWVLVIIGIVLEIIRMRNLGVLISSVAGFIFLHVASRYSRDGDTMGMLIAVLDSSFWLTTHIVTISLGYAGFVGAGLVAHLYLIQKIIRKEEDGQLQQNIRAIYGLFAFGLLFTVTGTVLGGLWADQAWGRFWGWDPKENGALLIILWGLIIFHARVAGLIKDIGLAAGAVMGVVMVMCTWIGVNLMGIGLHSYGKASGGAGVFVTYLVIELTFLAVTLIILRKKKTINVLNQI